MRLLSLPPRRPVDAKISATSRAGRPTTDALRGRHGLQWRDDFAQDLGGHVRIHRGGFELLVPEQDLDEADIDLLLEQVRGEAVAPIPISE